MSCNISTLADLLLGAEASLHTDFFKLLAGETLAGEYVCESTRVDKCFFRALFNHVYTRPQNDLHRAMQKSQSALSQQLTILSATLLCLVFTR